MSYIKHAKWDEILDLDEEPMEIIEESDVTAKIILWCSCSGINGDNPKCPRHRKE